MSLTFAREEVITVQPAAGLLSSTLASSLGSGNSGSSSNLAGSSNNSSGSGIGGGGGADAALSAGALEGTVTSLRAAQHAYTVGHTIAVVVQRGSASHPSIVTSADASAYDLRIAEDDGLAADPDFPVLDNSVAITGIGVDTFVLCDSASDRPVLRVRIPASTLTIRACEVDLDGTLPFLSLTCEGVEETDMGERFVVEMRVPE